jgi:hypothetical protein
LQQDVFGSLISQLNALGCSPLQLDATFRRWSETGSLDCSHSLQIQKRTGGTLDSELERKNEIGFICGPEENWDTMCTVLTQFKEKEGHCNVMKKDIENLDGGVKELKLGVWLETQRYQQGRGTLDAK